MDLNRIIKKYNLFILRILILMLKIKILEKTSFPMLLCQHRVIMSLWKRNFIKENKYCLVMRKNNYLTIHTMYQLCLWILSKQQTNIRACIRPSMYRKKLWEHFLEVLPFMFGFSFDLEGLEGIDRS